MERGRTLPNASSPPPSSSCAPPRACHRQPGKTEKETVTTALPLARSRVDVGLHLEHRRKGLLWYSTYMVTFQGVYAFRNPSEHDEEVIFALDFPAS